MTDEENRRIDGVARAYGVTIGETAAPDAGTVAQFKRDLAALVNRYSFENGSDTPDFLLAEYMFDAFLAFQRTSNAREKWYGRDRSQIADSEAPQQ